MRRQRLPRQLSDPALSATSFPHGQALLTIRSAPVAIARRLTRPAERREAGRFLVEGPQAVREALAAGSLLEVFATPEAAARYPELLHTCPTHLVDERALASLADAVTPQGLVGVSPLLDRPLDELPLDARLVCLLAEPRDPGNLGTIIRTSDAAGADAVVIAGDAVDPHNSKAVRASAGSLWHLPILRTPNTTVALAYLRQRGLQLLAADGRAALTLPALEASARLAAPTAWIFGTEAHGLPAELVAQCDDSVAVPLHGRAESLNLATAAAICLYASVRAQRWQTRAS